MEKTQVPVTEDQHFVSQGQRFREKLPTSAILIAVVIINILYCWLFFFLFFFKIPLFEQFLVLFLITNTVTQRAVLEMCCVKLDFRVMCVSFSSSLSKGAET